MSTSSQALQVSEHPWEARTLPRRPTRLVAIPPAAPRPYRPLTLGRILRSGIRVGRVLVRAGAAVLESAAFLLLLGSLLSALWAFSHL